MNPPRKETASQEREVASEGTVSGHEIVGKADLVLKEIKNPVDDYPDRPYEEASKGVVNFNPANPDHQEDRVAHSPDYVEKTPKGYISPIYEGPVQ